MTTATAESLQDESEAFLADAEHISRLDSHADVVKAVDGFSRRWGTWRQNADRFAATMHAALVSNPDRTERVLEAMHDRVELAITTLADKPGRRPLKWNSRTLAATKEAMADA